MSVITSFNVDGVEVVIGYDEDANPREMWENLGTLVCWHRRYQLGDPHSFDTPDEFEAWWAEHGEGGIRLPVYLYDHSGVSMNTTGFSCPWDSGQVGYIYATAEKIWEWYSTECETTVVPLIERAPTPSMLEKAKKQLTSEVAEYDQYLTGDTYWCSVNGDSVYESVGGIFGRENLAETLRECTASLPESTRQRIFEHFEAV